MPISVLPTPFPGSPRKSTYSNDDPSDNSKPGLYPPDILDPSDPITLLKRQAKHSVATSAKGASALALLNSARSQYILAGTCENEGDLRGALTAFTKAAGLAQMVLGTVESSGNSGVKKELTDFMEKDSINLTSRMQAVEAKLRMLEEKERQSNDGPVSKPGGSIADRMKALQNSGLSISTAKSKRFSKDLHLVNGTAGQLSPDVPSPSPVSSRTASSADSPSTAAALSTLTGLITPSTLPGSIHHSTSSSYTSTSTSSTSASANIYSHAFVSPSTLGPPSPGSSPSSSPTILPASINRSFSTSSEFNAFNSHFPSIDELDGDGSAVTFSLPSVPTGRSTSSSRSVGSVGSASFKSGNSLQNRGSASSLKSDDKPYADLRLSSSPSGSGVHPHNTGSSGNGLVSPTPHAALRNFIVPVERPSSTPLRGGVGGSVWDSRPGSPSTFTGKLPPMAPIRPSGLSASKSQGNFEEPIPGTSSPSKSLSSSLPSASTSAIPQKNSCTPLELYTYLREHKVILLDARDRTEFEKGHINAGFKGAMGGVVCIEPVTSDSIEDSLVLAPSSEASTFNNRHKFDLVVLYDQGSTSFASGPPLLSSDGSSGGSNPDLNNLLRAIWEREFKKTLRRMPMMLLGGYDAWVQELGEEEVVASSSISSAGSSTPAVNSITKTSTSAPAEGVSASSRSTPLPVPSPIMAPSNSMQGSQGRNPFAPGGPLAASSSSSASSMARPSSPQTSTGRMRAGTSPSRASSVQGSMGHKSNYSLDQSGHSRSPAEVASVIPSTSTKSGRATPTQTAAPLPPHFSGSGAGRRPPMTGRTSSSLSTSSSSTVTGPMTSLPEHSVSLNGSTSIAYPSFSSSTYSMSSASSSISIRSPPPSASYPYSHPLDGNGIASPPQASINPSISRRRTSDYMDQGQEALSNMSGPISPASAGINGYAGTNVNGLNSFNGVNGYSGTYNGGIVNGISSMPRKPIDYPELNSSYRSNQVIRPPPAAASAGVSRISSPSTTGTGPSTTTTNSSVSSYHLPSSSTSASFASSSSPYLAAALTTKLGLPPLHDVPRLKHSDWPPRYWADSPIGTSGLKNLGNTCYMNAPMQCLSATVPFARFFLEADLKNVINYMNKMNSKGELTRAFSRLIRDIWHGDMPYLTPTDFRRTLCSLNKQYVGTDQHDSQEFLSFLLDGIHEDTNRIMSRQPLKRTPEDEEKLESMLPQLASEYEWQVWRQSNDSIIVDFFQGQLRNQLKCMSCHKTSTTYNAFSILSLPVPARTGKIPLQSCLKAFFNMEIMEGDDAWDCPRCKTKRRASKALSLARLPPVLVIHLKRFEANGRFSDKIDTFVEFPVKSLDFTSLMPPPLPSGADQSLLNVGAGMDMDPRVQIGPYKYDLYGVTNHYGNLSSGHYTAFVASRGGWLYYDDSSVKNVDVKQVVNQKAYVLFYKRVKA
ncbi:hypothetical protein D9757_004397 [Collybiopsis confluens]|uniref:ubiquitinyl hydrolase 1 n=1 Tax=Collybiopsis confluens TaxID=2823264 RepID=A0A8H5MD26_9AGAR|nr:hypothetical protein D9757_004397 [Collybiopsis confluens]